MDLKLLASISGSLISSILVFAVTRLIRLVKNRRNEKAKLAATQEKSFRLALNSDSIDVLGGYLDDHLGGFLVSEYVDNKTINHRVSSILNSIEEFVGQNIEIDSKITIPKTTLTQQESVPKDDFKDIFAKLETGVTWDALAATRRIVEIRLRKYASDAGIKLGKSSAGQLVNILANRNLIKKDVAQSLLYSISVANKAIHGYDVPIETAEEAVWTAQNAMNKMGLLSDSSSPR